MQIYLSSKYIEDMRFMCKKSDDHTDAKLFVYGIKKINILRIH